MALGSRSIAGGCRFASFASFASPSFSSAMISVMSRWRCRHAAHWRFTVFHVAVRFGFS